MNVNLDFAISFRGVERSHVSRFYSGIQKNASIISGENLVSNVPLF